MAPFRKTNTNNGKKQNSNMNYKKIQLVENLIISQINKNKNSNNNNTPTEVISAANGFSEGMKRNIGLL